MDQRPVPERSHAAYNHDGTDDADAFVLWHSAGELFADHNVHVVLGEQQVGQTIKFFKRRELWYAFVAASTWM